MKILVGCSIDRRTGEVTNRYREGTAEEARALAEALLRAAKMAQAEGRRANEMKRYEQ